MRRVTLVLAVLAAVGLAANAALAGSSSPSVALHVGTTMVGHHGHHGHSHGYITYGYGRPYRYRYYGYGGPVIVGPVVPSRPAVIYTVPAYPPPPPPVYRRYYYSPHGSVHYRGSGFGISIGF